MAKEILVLRVFPSEIEAGLAQQVLEDAGVKSFVLKDDAGGMEPHLQRTIGVSLLVNRGDAAQANQVLDLFDSN